MDMKSLMDAVDAEVDAQFKGEFTLGNLIDSLEKAPPDKYVMFDFGRFCPSTLDSYRGFYRFLALGYQNISYEDRPTVGELLEACREALGKTFTGYKGGDFPMDNDTPLWIANYGETSNTMIESAKMEDYDFIIHTKYVAD